MPLTRAATARDLDLVGDLISRGFAPDERHLYEYLRAHHPGFSPAGCRLAVTPSGGDAVACSIALRCEMRARGGWVPAAIITLVCTDPAHRRQGYGAAAVQDSLAYARQTGCRAAILYGIPGYYPRFGFVPVLPSWETNLDVATGQAWATGLGAAAGASQPLTLEPLHPEDAAMAAELFEAAHAGRPATVRRSAGPWSWRDRQSSGRLVLAGREASGAPDRAPASTMVAYAVADSQPAEGTLVVNDAATAGADRAPELLRALLQLAGSHRLGRLRLTLPPDLALVRAALLAGAETSFHPARAGMAAVLDWEGLLPGGCQVRPAGGGAGELWCDGRPVLQAHPARLVELALGYRSAADLEVDPSITWLQPRDQGVRSLAPGFGPARPRWVLEPFW